MAIVLPSEWHTARLSIIDGQSELAPATAPSGQTAWLDDTPIACLICEPDTPISGSLWIAALIVHPEHRRQGYGKEIVEALFDFSTHIQLNVDASNHVGIRFWRSLGFVSSSAIVPAKAAANGLLLERKVK